MEEQKREIRPFDNPELVVLRNPVARAKFGLSVVQSKILFEVIAFFKSRPEVNIMTINVRDLLDKIGVETKRVAYYVNEIEEMTKKHLQIPEGPEGDDGINYLAVNLLAGARFRIDRDGRGYIDIEISSMLKPYYLEIAKGDFFSYHIVNTRLLKSTYSIKLYLLLKSYRRFGKLEIGLEELRNVLEIGGETYKLYPDFKKRVLETAKKEMREKNDIFFEYDELRQFARNSKSPVVKIVFFIRDNPDQKLRVERLAQAKTARKAARKAAPDFAVFEENAADEPIIQTDLGPPKSEAKTVEKGPKNAQKSPKNRAGGGQTQTDLGPLKKAEKATIQTFLGASPRSEFGTGFFDEKTAAEAVRLFRFFDPGADESQILAYAAGLGHAPEAILDGLFYAQKQGTVKNIYAYLPTVVRGGAGQGLAKKAREKAEKAAAEAVLKQKLAALDAEHGHVLDAAEAEKRDLVRRIVAADAGATERVIGQIKSKFTGNFGIAAATAVEEFRERPLLRSLVLHEFRAMFPGEFDGSKKLKSLERRLEELKNEARGLDPAFRFSS